MPRSVLITGAAGGLGTRLRGLMRGLYPRLVLTDRATPKDLQPDETFVAADLAQLDEMERVMAGIDAVVHLGGMSVENEWQAILDANIIGLYNAFEAARRCGVKRVVFASSFHVVGYYRRNRRFGTEARVRPDSRYGASKAFGEALASLYADKHGLRVLSIRIGNIDDRPVDKRRLSGWLSPPDFLQLVRIGLEHPDLHCEIVWGVSDNERNWWDNEAALRLGYRPQSNAETLRDQALAAEAKLPHDPIGELFQGGGFASREFSGDLERM
ncbi:MAG: NAD(P)-dependent oxidoreductase [Alphaproteobacteria bacterium]|nr:NAD(P)-dependent oxidoreductase [Alphaproteobacteria bacterium]